ncbi:hypothetical protein IGS75_04110 [Gluconobacter sphaericus]|uniref:hypothetical protein n=1 Tax=Gluconobacter sphaericus TaxID=574987 RepID=UPI0019209D6A|nr:hypothetical protein [Gluconobacter sphaericus]QQX91790.1 hypothetical protein IGS75_04110 [Gluconobacter sphaericus]
MRPPTRLELQIGIAQVLNLDGHGVLAAVGKVDYVKILLAAQAVHALIDPVALFFHRQHVKILRDRPFRRLGRVEIRYYPEQDVAQMPIIALEIVDHPVNLYRPHEAA